MIFGRRINVNPDGTFTEMSGDGVGPTLSVLPPGVQVCPWQVHFMQAALDHASLGRQATGDPRGCASCGHAEDCHTSTDGGATWACRWQNCPCPSFTATA